MGKSASALLKDANDLATQKAQLAQRKMLNQDNAAKLKTAIDKKVSTAIKVLNRRPKKTGSRPTASGLFTSTYTIR